MNWARILAFVAGMVEQGLLARNEYLAAENRILKAQLKGRLRLTDGALRDCRYLLHDRDTKYTQSFGRSLHQAGSNHSCCRRAART
jgi:hypothetical protein